MKKIILTMFSFFLIFSIILPIPVQASTFTEESYRNAQDYTILETKVLAESSKQAIELYQLMAEWEVYSTSADKQSSILQDYISNSQKRFAFVKDYNTPLAKEINSAYTSYLSYLKKQLQAGPATFVTSKVVFIDYLEVYLSETQSNYLSFKTGGLDKFLNAQIYTKTTQIAISDTLSNDANTKKDGQAALSEIIYNLEQIEKDSATPTVIKNYDRTYINYYKKVLNGDFSGANDLISYEEDKVNGLMSVGDVVYEREEFLNYMNVFNKFSDYPTLEISLTISSGSIEKQLNLLTSQEPKTKNVQKLKQLHYEFLYQLSEYKKNANGDTSQVSGAYNNFFNEYSYLNSYYSKVNDRFSGFTANQVVSNIETLKEHASCINPNMTEIMNLSYAPVMSKDSYSYRTFLISSDQLPLLNIFIIGLIILVIAAGIAFVARKAYIYYQENKNNYDDDDDFRH